MPFTLHSKSSTVKPKKASSVTCIGILSTVEPTCSRTVRRVLSSGGGWEFEKLQFDAVVPRVCGGLSHRVGVPVMQDPKP